MNHDTERNTCQFNQQKGGAMNRDTYKQDKNKAQKRNELILSDFLEWLLLKGLSVKTMKKHEDNMRFYINDYLLFYCALPPEEGVDRIDEFMKDWLPENALWVSKTAIKEYCVGLKKFYTFMCEIGYVGKSDLDTIKHIIKDQMDDWVDGVETHYDDMNREIVDDYLSAMEYSLEEYLDDIDMGTLMEFVKRHKHFKSFDAFHGTACGFAALPLSSDYDSNRELFIGNMMQNVLCSLEEKKRFEEALMTFYDRTEDIIFAGDFVPYCGSWEFKDIKTNDPKDWCIGFMAAFSLFKDLVRISDRDYLEIFQDGLSPLMLLSFDQNNPDFLMVKNKIIEKEGAWEPFQERMFRHLPDIPLLFADIAEEFMEEFEEKKNAAPVRTEKVGRNDSCPCGSGKKYKKCCGSK